MSSSLPGSFLDKNCSSRRRSLIDSMSPASQATVAARNVGPIYDLWTNGPSPRIKIRSSGTAGTVTRRLRAVAQAPAKSTRGSSAALPRTEIMNPTFVGCVSRTAWLQDLIVSWSLARANKQHACLGAFFRNEGHVLKRWDAAAAAAAAAQRGDARQPDASKQLCVLAGTFHGLRAQTGSSSRLPRLRSTLLQKVGCC